MVDMTPVKSSQIASVGHDPETGTLHIKFVDRVSKKTGDTTPGSTYEYGPHADLADHHAGLLAADADPDKSVGKYFGHHVKSGGYSFRKIS
jgi:KTSC domain